MLASAAIVVLGFVSTWVLRKLASAARKVGAKLKGLAAKFKSKRKAKQDAKAPNKHHDNQDPPNAKKHEHGPKNPKTREEHKREQEAKKKQDRLDKATRELPPKITAALAKRPNKLTFKARSARGACTENSSRGPSS